MVRYMLRNVKVLTHQKPDKTWHFRTYKNLHYYKIFKMSHYIYLSKPIENLRKLMVLKPEKTWFLIRRRAGRLAFLHRSIVPYLISGKQILKLIVDSIFFFVFPKLNHR
jgi:hypothetical protein